MKKYIRICACCGNTYETDVPAFTILADGTILPINHNTLCKSCNDDYKAGKKAVIEKFGMPRFLKKPRPQG